MYIQPILGLAGLYLLTKTAVRKAYLPLLSYFEDRAFQKQQKIAKPFIKQKKGMTEVKAKLTPVLNQKSAQMEIDITPNGATVTLRHSNQIPAYIASSIIPTVLYFSARQLITREPLTESLKESLTFAGSWTLGVGTVDEVWFGYRETKRYQKTQEKLSNAKLEKKNNKRISRRHY